MPVNFIIKKIALNNDFIVLLRGSLVRSRDTRYIDTIIDTSMAQLYNEIIKEIDELTELFNNSSGNTNDVDMTTLNSLAKSNNEIRNDFHWISNK